MLEKTMQTEGLAMSDPQNMLELHNLKMHFAIRNGLFGQAGGYVKAVDGVTLAIRQGETFGLVGESGCGKSTIGRSIVRAYNISGGQMLYQQESGNVVDLARLTGRELRDLRHEIRMIFQDPYSSLNPRMTVFENISEALKISSTPRSEMQDRVEAMLRRVGLRPEYMTRYPHAFSGGERQRIVIARSLITRPRLVIADEAVSALDVSVRAQILNLLKELQDEFQLTYLFISHDLSVIRHICDRIAVMYVGKLVETDTSEALFRQPKHPYTETLLSAVPITDPLDRGKRNRIRLSGEVADPSNPPKGCYFHPRCSYAKDRCSKEEPTLQTIGQGTDYVRTVNCHFADELTLQGVIADN